MNINANKPLFLLALIFLSTMLLVFHNASSISLFTDKEFILKNHLIPEKIKVSRGVTEMISHPDQNKFALLNGHLEFAIAILNKNGSVKSDVILSKFP